MRDLCPTKNDRLDSDTDFDGSNKIKSYHCLTQDNS